MNSFEISWKFLPVLYWILIHSYDRFQPFLNLLNLRYILILLLKKHPLHFSTHSFTYLIQGMGSCREREAEWWESSRQTASCRHFEDCEEAWRLGEWKWSDGGRNASQWKRSSRWWQVWSRGKNSLLTDKMFSLWSSLSSLLLHYFNGFWRNIRF